MMWPINATYMYQRCEMTFSIKTLHLHLMSTHPPTLPSDKLSFSLIFKFKKEGSYIGRHFLLVKKGMKNCLIRLFTSFTSLRIWNRVEEFFRQSYQNSTRGTQKFSLAVPNISTVTTRPFPKILFSASGNGREDVRFWLLYTPDVNIVFYNTWVDQAVKNG